MHDNLKHGVELQRAESCGDRLENVLEAEQVISIIIALLNFVIARVLVMWALILLMEPYSLDK